MGKMNPLEEGGRGRGEDELKAIHSKFGWFCLVLVFFVCFCCCFISFSNRFIIPVLFCTNSLYYSQFSLTLRLSG